MTRIAFITGCNDTYQPLLELSLPGKHIYCKRHGYDLVVETNRFNTTMFRPAWEKIPTILEYIPLYDWIFWSDVDSLIMNHDICLEDMIDETSDIIASLLQFDSRNPHIHLGNVLIRNSPLVREMLMMTYRHKSTWKNDPQEEEGAFFQMVWKNIPCFQQAVKRVNWKFFFSLPKGFSNSSGISFDFKRYQWKPGMFIVHMTKPLSLNERVVYMDYYNNLL